MTTRSRYGTRRLGTALAGGAMAISLTLSGCSGGSSGSAGGGGDGQSAPPANALKSVKGVQKVSFWEAMNGTNATVLKQLVSRFNKAHAGKIEVDPTYVGTYDDAIAKYKASVQSKSTPDVIQTYDVGTRFMIDSRQTVPMQSFIDRDKVDVSDLQPNIAAYYSVDKKLYSMPFNTSVPVLYFNKTLFKKAGLDPNKPPTTLAEIRADSEKLSKAKGGPAKYGFGAAIYGWFLEQFMAMNDAQYCNNNNGRSARATKVLFDDKKNLVPVVAWWQKMVKDGLAANTGTDTTTAQKAFTSGQAAMLLESTGQVGNFSKAATAGGFDLGVAYYPKPDASSAGGPIIGGASLWINGVGHSDAQKEAAWEFVKYLSSPTIQAAWHVGTGYFPISKGALQEPNDVAWRKKYPQFNVAVQELEQTKRDTATQGCLFGVMPQSRKASEDGLEKALNGADPQQAMTAAVQSLAPTISQYNRAIKAQSGE